MKQNAKMVNRYLASKLKGDPIQLYSAAAQTMMIGNCFERRRTENRKGRDRPEDVIRLNMLGQWQLDENSVNGRFRRLVLCTSPWVSRRLQRLTDHVRLRWKWMGASAVRGLRYVA